MINERFTLKEAFMEGKQRVDGATAFICMFFSLIAPFVVAVFKFIKYDAIQFNWLGFTVPIITFLIYVRSRQLDADESRVRKIINSVLIGVVSFSFIYAVNFR